MTIGKSSRKSSVRSSIRAPKFLDKASGFYGRLDEPEDAREAREADETWRKTEDIHSDGGGRSDPSKDVVHISGAEPREEAEVFDFHEGMMEGDGETLLQRKSSRRSSRWRRSSRRKQKVAEEEEAVRNERPSLGTERLDKEEKMKKMEEEEEEEEKEEEEARREQEPTVVHFQIRGDADDQVLIRDKKMGKEKEEGAEERRIRMEQEKGMKMVKRNSVKNYRKALDRAFRRGWEAFVTNLYSVTLTPLTSSTPPSSSSLATEKKNVQSSVLAEFR